MLTVEKIGVNWIVVVGEQLNANILFTKPETIKREATKNSVGETESMFILWL